MAIDNTLMAVVINHNELYLVMLGGVVIGRFDALLDANCFALQLMERGLAEEARLVSGVIVPK